MAQFLSKTILYFYFFALLFLCFGLTFGLIGALQYIIPGFLKESLSFEKVRPLHVSAVVFWILMAAMGSVLTFLQEHEQKQIRYPRLLQWQLFIFAMTIPIIFLSYFLGIFGGREYWEFHPLLSIPIMLGWLLFLINIFGTVTQFTRQPVYVWMWLTGTAFFFFTYLESNLWQFPWIRNEVVKDMTIQWKSYGSMVGAWNMLIYGSSIYLMDKIAGHQKYSYSNLGFAIFFLGFFNGLFNWGHHIYTLPTHNYVKLIGYGVSMTELILFARIIYLWKNSISNAKKYYHQLTYKFIMAADFWVFFTLGLAILMSVPAFNIYMHGTHVIVAHTMGATIGINSMLLLAFIFEVTSSIKDYKYSEKTIVRGYILLQISLLFFVLSLLGAGFMKGFWQMQERRTDYTSMMETLRPWFVAFATSGFFVIIGFVIIVLPIFNRLRIALFKRKNSQ